jgi:hypothetical protein
MGTCYFALSIRPFLMFSLICPEVNVDFDAALIAIKRSKIKCDKNIKIAMP